MHPARVVITVTATLAISPEFSLIYSAIANIISITASISGSIFSNSDMARVSRISRAASSMTSIFSETADRTADIISSAASMNAGRFADIPSSIRPIPSIAAFESCGADFAIPSTREVITSAPATRSSGRTLTVLFTMVSIICEADCDIPSILETRPFIRFSTTEAPISRIAGRYSEIFVTA